MKSVHSSRDSRGSNESGAAIYDQGSSCNQRMGGTVFTTLFSRMIRDRVLLAIFVTYHAYLIIISQSKWFSSAPSFHIALFGLDFVNEPYVRSVFAAAALGSAAVALFGSGRALIVSGVLGLVCMASVSEGTVAFGYFPSLGLIALGAGKLTGERGVPIFFIASVYLFASFHKTMNFTAMIENVRNTYGQYLDPVLLPIEAPLLYVFSLIAVPLDFSIGALLVFRRTRRYGLLLAVGFHVGVMVTAGMRPFLTQVSLMCMVFHAIATSLSPSIWPKSRGAIAACAFFVAWGLTPIFYDYRSAQIGWAMMSGGRAGKAEIEAHSFSESCPDIEGFRYIRREGARVFAIIPDAAEQFERYQRHYCQNVTR